MAAAWRYVPYLDKFIRWTTPAQERSNIYQGMQQNPLKHLFQQEFSKMVAVISKVYGLQHIEIAEDIVSETFLLATENWREKGLPKNPAAWLYLVAKQKTAYHFRRNKILEKK